MFLPRALPTLCILSRDRFPGEPIANCLSVGLRVLSVIIQIRKPSLVVSFNRINISDLRDNSASLICVEHKLHISYIGRQDGNAHAERFQDHNRHPFKLGSQDQTRRDRKEFSHVLDKWNAAYIL